MAWVGVETYVYVGLWLWKAAKQLQKDEIKGLYLYRKIHKERL